MQSAAGRPLQQHATVYSTFASDWLRTELLPAYELEGVEECSLFQRGTNDTYRIGAAGGTYALRVYRSRWRTRQAVEDELATLQRLLELGVPVAGPIARRDGVSITLLEAPEGPRCAVLFSWADGLEPQYRNTSHAQQYGRSAARLHNAAEALVASSARPKLDLDYLLNHPLAQLRTVLRSRPAAEAYLEGLADRLRKRIDAAGDLLGTWGFCHGDLHGGNARIRGDHLTLFDFDCCGSGWHLFDLATYRWAARIRELEAPAWESFSGTYLQLRPQAEASLQLVPTFVILRHLWLMGLRVGDAAECGASFVTDDFIDNLIQFCMQLEASSM